MSALDTKIETTTEPERYHVSGIAWSETRGKVTSQILPRHLRNLPAQARHVCPVYMITIGVQLLHIRNVCLSSLQAMLCLQFMSTGIKQSHDVLIFRQRIPEWLPELTNVLNGKYWEIVAHLNQPVQDLGSLPGTHST